jgi:hypothetical protein
LLPFLNLESFDTRLHFATPRNFNCRVSRRCEFTFTKFRPLALPTVSLTRYSHFPDQLKFLSSVSLLSFSPQFLSSVSLLRTFSPPHFLINSTFRLQPSLILQLSVFHSLIRVSKLLSSPFGHPTTLSFPLPHHFGHGYLG